MKKSMRVFDPNTNPYADDLLRLALAPATRYLPHERRVLADTVAAKLYQVKTRDYWPRGYPYIYIDKHLGRRAVGITVVFEFEKDLEIDVDYQYFNRYDELVLLSVGVQGVVEVYNGPGKAFEPQKIEAALYSLWNGHCIDEDLGEGTVPIRSDNEIAGDYQGRKGRDGANGGGNGRDGGDGGDDGGDGPGPEGIPGGGGARELMNHPILFAVESDVFDAIMREV
jgi:hypothetical protein